MGAKNDRAVREPHGTVMTGKVSKIEEGSIYLELGKGLRCWFDLLAGSSIEVGDIVTGNLWSYGGQELFNTTRGCKVKVFMEGHR
jgi:hypothetical protein